MPCRIVVMPSVAGRAHPLAASLCHQHDAPHHAPPKAATRSASYRIKQDLNTKRKLIVALLRAAVPNSAILRLLSSRFRQLSHMLRTFKFMLCRKARPRPSDFLGSGQTFKAVRLVRRCSILYSTRCFSYRTGPRLDQLQLVVVHKE